MVAQVTMPSCAISDFAGPAEMTLAFVYAGRFQTGGASTGMDHPFWHRRLSTQRRISVQPYNIMAFQAVRRLRRSRKIALWLRHVVATRFRIAIAMLCPGIPSASDDWTARQTDNRVRYSGSFRTLGTPAPPLEN